MHKTTNGKKIFIECIEGYKFYVTNDQATQFFDEEKKAVRCEK